MQPKPGALTSRRNFLQVQSAAASSAWRLASLGPTAALNFSAGTRSGTFCAAISNLLAQRPLSTLFADALGPTTKTAKTSVSSRKRQAPRAHWMRSSPLQICVSPHAHARAPVRGRRDGRAMPAGEVGVPDLGGLHRTTWRARSSLIEFCRDAVAQACTPTSIPCCPGAGRVDKGNYLANWCLSRFVRGPRVLAV